MIRRRVLLLLLVLTFVVSAACARLPESGPVTAVETESARAEAETLVDFDPPEPREGADPEEIVQSFLDAMLETPLGVSGSAAKTYLTQDAARSWRPDGTIVYTDYSVSSSVGEVQTELTDAVRFDSRGTWRGPLSDRRSSIDFSVELEDGEWRIDDLPQALILQQGFFDARFERATVNWFDPSGQVLVPEPVYVPGGEGMPAALMRSLLQGPPPELRSVVRSYLPTGQVTSGVPVNGEGQAEVRLSTEFPDLVNEELDRAVAQIAWTLRDVPGVEFFRLSDPEGRVGLPGGRSAAPVSLGGEFDATAGVINGNLYGLVDGALFSEGTDGFARVGGTVGQEDTGWRSFAVEPGGRLVVGVDQSGKTAEISAVQSTDGAPIEVASNAINLLKPAWDQISGPWLVDQSADGAVVLLAGERRPREIRVPGVTGKRVRAFEVSHDGSRLVALLRGDRGDRLVVARIVRNTRGRVIEVQPAQRVYVGTESAVRMLDLAWSSPTSVRVLFATSGEVSQVRDVSLDGSTEAVGSPLATVRGRMKGIVGSPALGEPGFAVGPREVSVLGGGTVPPLPEGIDRSTLTYPG